MATTVRVPVNPQVLRWACERGRLGPGEIERRFPKFSAWEAGTSHPTLRELERFAAKSRTPIGFLFLTEPPEETLPIPDFRTIADRPVRRPSADLLDTIYLCQQRQDWYREEARVNGEPPLPFVGSANLSDGAPAAAARIRETLGFDLEERQRLGTWADAARRFMDQAGEAGVLVMVSGVVGSHTGRKLDVHEFRGFALVDDRAPLVFVNGRDSASARMFTLAHELAHIWLGDSALSDAESHAPPDHRVERFCNEVAAETLLPLAVLRDEHRPDTPLGKELPRLARRFKVSTLVVLRRLRDLERLSDDAYWAAYRTEAARRPTSRSGTGGTFYATANRRLGSRFARAVIVATLEGRSSFTEAFRLLGVRKMATFRELSRQLKLTA